MDASDSTCWSMIQAAARGSSEGRERFARRYERPVRAYFAARWKAGGGGRETDDAVQDVFLECFKQGGALERMGPAGRTGFRGFLFGIARNVALRSEEKRGIQVRRAAPGPDGLDHIEADDAGPVAAFQKCWAMEMVREAADRMSQDAIQNSEAARKRVEILHLRFYEGLPIREIATRWGADAAFLHHEYAQARKEFRRFLGDVVAFHQPNDPDTVEEECEHLIRLLQA